MSPSPSGFTAGTWDSTLVLSLLLSSACFFSIFLVKIENLLMPFCTAYFNSFLSLFYYLPWPWRHPWLASHLTWLLWTPFYCGPGSVMFLAGEMVLRVFSNLKYLRILVHDSSHVGSYHRPSSESQLQFAVSVISFWPPTSISTEKGFQVLFISLYSIVFPE